MEKIEVDNRDRPIEDIVLQKSEVFVDPFKEADDELAAERAAELAERQQAAAEEAKRKLRAQPTKVYREGVGKYLNTEVAANQTATANLNQPTAVVKKAKRSADYKFNDFSAW